jgi:hypothetical protein
MPSPDTAVPVELLLEAARQRVSQTSLRETAAEIGMEHSGLDKLLKRPQKPRPSTIRKLTEWYLRRAAAGELEVRPEVAQAALSVLVQHLPLARRSHALAHLTDVLHEITTQEKSQIPEWLKQRL